ncbi:MAG TPA: sensor histidine kinase [Steroidobacteraceae bacterium]|nr:sensor histidine kinase [Steroidobacteraceae bacterium]
MTQPNADLAGLARHFNSRREAILLAWRTAVKRDPRLNTSDALPRGDLYDHIPALIVTFSRQLANPAADNSQWTSALAHKSAAAHGLQRWQQGYDLREVTRELGKLNECMVAELQDYTAANPELSRLAVATAHRIWAVLCSTGFEESVGQYFQLQQQEAAGHVRDLESALVDIRSVEQQRGDLWRQAAHDLRGNLGVVASATVGLTNSKLRESSRDDFVRILMRNVTSLHHLLDDVTSLARLQAGREERRIEPIDVSSIMQQLCEGIGPLAQQRHLFLNCDGPPGFAADGDAIKIRRIAQNLILNAVKYTREGGITVKWGDSDASDAKRWQLCVVDTGPGFHTRSGEPLAAALERPDDSPLPCDSVQGANTTPAQHTDHRRAQAEAGNSRREEAGEGIGLSIVKRLCDMLDATIELKSEPNVGTSFRILFPRHYNS